MAKKPHPSEKTELSYDPKEQETRQVIRTCLEILIDGIRNVETRAETERRTLGVPFRSLGVLAVNMNKLRYNVNVVEFHVDWEGNICGKNYSAPSNASIDSGCDPVLAIRRRDPDEALMLGAIRARFVAIDCFRYGFDGELWRISKNDSGSISIQYATPDQFRQFRLNTIRCLESWHSFFSAMVKRADEARGSPGEIPPEHLTEPMSQAEAGVRMYKEEAKDKDARERLGKRIGRRMKAGELRYVQVGERSFQFDRRQFPSET